MGPGRYNLIYEFFKKQIEFGYYREGDCLPSVETLCSIYQVSLQTVRSAYLQLQKERYIQLARGRHTVVLYNAAADVYLHSLQDYYLARKESLQQLDRNLRTLFYPLFLAGARLLRKEDMLAINANALRVATEPFQISFYCGRQAILAHKNRLAFDLFTESILFYQFLPSLAMHVSSPETKRQLKQLSEQMADDCEQGDREELVGNYFQTLELLNHSLYAFIKQAESVRPVPAPVRFHWQVYRERPQKCYSVAAHLIGQIYIREAYGPGDFLPSYGTMAESYSVSFSTVRRAVELLAGLGVVTTHQGLGTQVAASADAASSDKILQRIMSMFLQVLQIVSISLERIIEQFFPGPRWRTDECLCTLRAQQAQGNSFRIFLIGAGILLYSNDDRPIKEIWDKFHEALLLGLPLLETCAATQPETGSQLLSHAALLIQGLDTEDRFVFHDSLKSMMRLVISTAEQILRNLDSRLPKDEEEIKNV
ncbi:GntR family transcriptional regulator [Clostridium sp. D33t1_170424_F3]|uniref:GntR family transcriptional regulator n=1 Tax=Clostridium sp. D33t1_170424_F3 TaxID=2787099 RepID=UPI0018AB5BB9|nr:GntR family transcriptional regulator [Clostridium sp. D33t1_170424_F3]